MVRACQEHGVIFMAGHVMNFFHGVRHAKKLINDGVIGKVLYCHSARNGWEEQQPTISWKKIREKSGGHLYHHIHELDCVQFLMGGMPEEVTMTGGNVAHQGEAFGDEDDMLFVNMQFSDNRYAVLEWGSAFHWPEHYVLIQGTKGAIKIDMCDCGGTLKIDGKDEHFLVHESQEEDDDRTINSVGVYQDVISDDELVQLTGQTTYADNIFYAGDATKSNYFRIPSLLTLDSGTVIAAADARYGGTHDSKSKINTAFAKSTDGGNTWGEPTLPMKFDDYVAKNIDWPRDSVGKNVQIQGSASYIDPVLLEDKSTHRVFLFADLMPAGIGSSNASVGSGFKEINGKKYLKLHWKDDSSSDYNYSIRENGIIYDDTTNASTEYSVDGEYNLYKNGEALTCKQYDYNFEGTSLLETPTDTDVNMNVFYKDSMFKVFPTNYLAMKYSDDEGDNWSDLNIVSTFKPEESKFLVLGPGIGKQITTGENAGRLIVPLYSKSSAELGFMYSDDHGNSWNYVEADHNTGGATAEAQIVEMPDGSLKTYLRTGSGYIAEVTSIDGGETWSDRVPLTEIATTSYGTQLSVINYSQPIDGKPAIILSAPNATNGRKNGKIWIGLINETGQSGVNKYSVEWKYCYSVDTPQMGYSYSCLTELPDGKVGLLYEKYLYRNIVSTYRYI